MPNYYLKTSDDKKGYRLHYVELMTQTAPDDPPTGTGMFRIEDVHVCAIDGETLPDGGAINSIDQIVDGEQVLVDMVLGVLAPCPSADYRSIAAAMMAADWD